MHALEAIVRYAQTSVVFMDAEGCEHIVVLPPGIPADEARAAAEERLAVWKEQGRAVYAEPLSFVEVV